METKCAWRGGAAGKGNAAERIRLRVLNSVGNVNSVRYKVICSMKDEN